MYNIYIDKDEVFEAKVDISGGNTTDVKCRVILESSGCNLIYYGSIKDGKCNIPINKVKGILTEGTTGIMKLEIIADDTWFEPWTSDFNVKQHTKVQVKEVNQDNELKKNVVIESVEIKPQLDKNKFKHLLKEALKVDKRFINEKFIKRYYGEGINPLILKKKILKLIDKYDK